ncbi:MAG TPA: hypothetical protein VKU19_34820 [Bryobacteraceae bacterium]|nr:hypothetical protein [Bryobacteraceae bacterium]
MFTMWAVLVYSASMAIPIYLLHRYHNQAWHWHVLAVVASMVLGLAPVPTELQGGWYDLLFGFVFVALLFWGAGGLMINHPGHKKHA